jgi:hypothetical protein
LISLLHIAKQNHPFAQLQRLDDARAFGVVFGDIFKGD